MSEERGPADLLRQRAKVERRLLRTEQSAERDLLDAQERLTSAQIKLEKAQARVDRRHKRLAAALDALREAQAARAHGPDGAVNLAVAAEVLIAEPELVIALPERDDSMLPSRTATAIQAEDDEPSDPRPTRRRKPREIATGETMP
jgi:hypothetical protein